MTNKCIKCGGNLIEEGLSDIYFCENCKGLFFKDKNTGEFKSVNGVKIK